MLYSVKKFKEAVNIKMSFNKFRGSCINNSHKSYYTDKFGYPSLIHVDLCMVVSPPCMSEADRYSLEALRTIHQMMDDDQDGGIEVEESVEVQTPLFITPFP